MPDRDLWMKCRDCSNAWLGNIKFNNEGSAVIESDSELAEIARDHHMSGFRSYGADHRSFLFYENTKDLEKDANRQGHMVVSSVTVFPLGRIHDEK